MRTAKNPTRRKPQPKESFTAKNTKVAKKRDNNEVFLNHFMVGMSSKFYATLAFSAVNFKFFL